MVLDATADRLRRLDIESDLQRKGRRKVCGSVTLTENVTSTTVSDPGIPKGGLMFLFPQTSNAAGAVATTYAAPASAAGLITITHANAATTDRTFSWVVFLPVV